MISEELKKLVFHLGSLVVVENNQPKFVVMTYDKFNKVIHKSFDNSQDFDKDIREEAEEAIARLNKEILVLKEQTAEKEKEIISE